MTPRRSLKQTIIHSFIGGIFTGLGLTVGIAIVAYILGHFVNIFGGLPIVGYYLANIVSATLDALQRR